MSLDLSGFDKQDWLTRDETMDAITEALGHICKVRLIEKEMEARLLSVDTLALKAGLLGSNPNGLFKL